MYKPSQTGAQLLCEQTMKRTLQKELPLSEAESESGPISYQESGHSGVIPQLFAGEFPNLTGSEQSSLMPDQPYTFSFTAATLLPDESVRLAELLVELGAEELDRIRLEEDPLDKKNVQTGQRQTRELLKRLTVLPEPILHQLLRLDRKNQTLVLYLGACLTYQFMADFVVYVLREKVAVFDYTLFNGDYERFYRARAESHPELEELRESSRRKVKQRIFTMLEQAEILVPAEEFWRINIPFLPHNVQQLLLREDPHWLRYFLLSDTAIATLTKT